MAVDRGLGVGIEVVEMALNMEVLKKAKTNMVGITMGFPTGMG